MMILGITRRKRRYSGQEPLGKPGHLWISAERNGKYFTIRIEDDGVGRTTFGNQGWGIGISNAQARLEALYGREGFRLDLTDRDRGGTTVTIELPFESLA